MQCKNTQKHLCTRDRLLYIFFLFVCRLVLFSPSAATHEGRAVSNIQQCVHKTALDHNASDTHLLLARLSENKENFLFKTTQSASKARTIIRLFLIQNVKYHQPWMNEPPKSPQTLTVCASTHKNISLPPSPPLPPPPLPSPPLSLYQTSTI